MKWLIFLLWIAVMSCKKDKPPVKPNKPQIQSDTTTMRVLVSNEGTFNYANSSVSVVDFNTNTVINDIYKENNNSTNLGDILQSISFIGNYAYLVLNNSNKIEVVNKIDFKRVTSIGNLTSPRFILQVNNTKAYVSDLYANKITILNLETNTIAGYIPCKGWTEKMILHNNLIYTTNYNSDYLYVINPIADVITDSILISKGAESIVSDKNNNLWIACQSDQFNQYYGALYCVNPLTKQIVFQFKPNNFNFSVNDLIIDSNKENLYFTNNGLYKHNINQTTFNTAKFLDFKGRNIYGFNINFSNNTLYLCDARDYVQKGQVIRVNLNNLTFIDSLNVGVNPNMVYFN